MMHKQLRFGTGFRVSLSNDRAQAAEMTLVPGESEGGPDNSHRGSDQWMFVVSGTGVAIVSGKKIPLKTGKLVLITRRHKHEIRNTGTTPLKTLNFYVAPAYTEDGEPLPAGRP